MPVTPLTVMKKAHIVDKDINKYGNTLEKYELNKLKDYIRNMVRSISKNNRGKTRLKVNSVLKQIEMSNDRNELESIFSKFFSMYTTNMRSSSIYTQGKISNMYDKKNIVKRPLKWISKKIPFVGTGINKYINTDKEIVFKHIADINNTIDIIPDHVMIEAKYFGDERIMDEIKTDINNRITELDGDIKKNNELLDETNKKINFYTEINTEETSLKSGATNINNIITRIINDDDAIKYGNNIKNTYEKIKSAHDPNVFNIVINTLTTSSPIASEIQTAMTNLDTAIKALPTPPTATSCKDVINRYIELLDVFIKGRKDVYSRIRKDDKKKIDEACKELNSMNFYNEKAYEIISQKYGGDIDEFFNQNRTDLSNETNKKTILDKKNKDLIKELHDNKKLLSGEIYEINLKKAMILHRDMLMEEIKDTGTINTLKKDVKNISSTALFKKEFKDRLWKRFLKNIIGIRPDMADKLNEEHKSKIKKETEKEIEPILGPNPNKVFENLNFKYSEIKTNPKPKEEDLIWISTVTDMIIKDSINKLTLENQLKFKDILSDIQNNSQFEEYITLNFKSIKTKTAIYSCADVAPDATLKKWDTIELITSKESIESRIKSRENYDIVSKNIGNFYDDLMKLNISVNRATPSGTENLLKNSFALDHSVIKGDNLNPGFIQYLKEGEEALYKQYIDPDSDLNKFLQKWGINIYDFHALFDNRLPVTSSLDSHIIKNLQNDTLENKSISKKYNDISSENYFLFASTVENIESFLGKENITHNIENLHTLKDINDLYTGMSAKDRQNAIINDFGIIGYHLINTKNNAGDINEYFKRHFLEMDNNIEELCSKNIKSYNTTTPNAKKLITLRRRIEHLKDILNISNSYKKNTYLKDIYDIDYEEDD